MPPSSSASSLFRLRFGTAGAGLTREGFESGWLKFNPSPAVRGLSATAVTWEHKLPLLFPHASFSCQLPALSTFPAASHAALGAWQGTADPLPAPLPGGRRRGIRGTVLKSSWKQPKKWKNEAKMNYCWSSFVSGYPDSITKCFRCYQPNNSS